MRRIKVVSTLAALAVATFFATTLHAYPEPGVGQETYVTYFSDAAHTSVVGVRSVGRGSTCTIYHTTWGTTSSYSIVTVASCDSPI